MVPTGLIVFQGIPEGSLMGVHGMSGGFLGLPGSLRGISGSLQGVSIGTPKGLLKSLIV